MVAAILTSSIWVISFALLSFLPIPVQRRIGWLWIVAIVPITILLVRAFGVSVVFVILFAVGSMLRRPLGGLMWHILKRVQR